MALMNEVKQGVDLTHPKPTIGYVVAAVVAIAIISFAYWMYMKAKQSVSGVGKSASNMASGLESQAIQGQWL